MVDTSVLQSAVESNLKRRGLLPESFERQATSTPQEQIAEIIRRGLALRGPTAPEAPEEFLTPEAVVQAEAATPLAKAVEALRPRADSGGRDRQDRAPTRGGQPINAEDLAAALENAQRDIEAGVLNPRNIGAMAGQLSPIPGGRFIGAGIGELGNVGPFEDRLRNIGVEDPSISRGKAFFGGAVPFNIAKSLTAREQAREKAAKHVSGGFPSGLDINFGFGDEATRSLPRSLAESLMLGGDVSTPGFSIFEAAEADRKAAEVAAVQAAVERSRREAQEREREGFEGRGGVSGRAGGGTRGFAGGGTGGFGSPF